MSRPVFKTEFNTPSARTTCSIPPPPHPGALASSSELLVSEPTKDSAGCPTFVPEYLPSLVDVKGRGGGLQPLVDSEPRPPSLALK